MTKAQLEEKIEELESKARMISCYVEDTDDAIKTGLLTLFEALSRDKINQCQFGNMTNILNVIQTELNYLKEDEDESY